MVVLVFPSRATDDSLASIRLYLGDNIRFWTRLDAFISYVILNFSEIKSKISISVPE